MDGWMVGATEVQAMIPFQSNHNPTSQKKKIQSQSLMEPPAYLNATVHHSLPGNNCPPLPLPSIPHILIPTRHCHKHNHLPLLPLPSHRRGQQRLLGGGRDGAGRAGLLGGALLAEEGRHGLGVQCHGGLLLPARHRLLPGAAAARRQRAAHLHRLLRPAAPASAAGGWGVRLPQRGLRRRRLPQCRRRRVRRDGVPRRDGPQGGGGGGRPRRLQGGARAGGGGRRRVRPGPDGGPGAGVEEEAGGGDAVQEPDGRAPPPQAPQRPPLHAPLRRAQDQQDGQDVDPGGHHRLHEGAAGEDPAAAGGDGWARGGGVPGAQPQRDARQEHPQVRGGAQGGGGRHPGGDLLRRQAGTAAVDGEHAGHAGPGHPAVRRQLLQRLRHARLLLRDAAGDDQRGGHQAGAVQERRLRWRLLVERRRSSTTTTMATMASSSRKDNKVVRTSSCSSE